MKWITGLIPILLLFSGSCRTGNEGTARNANAPDAAATSARPSVSPASSPAPTSKPDESGPDENDFEGTSGRTEKKNPNFQGWTVLSDVRSARHDGFDRVVFEFSGVELPTYRIEYLDKAEQCGSGDEVPLAGAAALSVLFTTAYAHTEEGEPTIKERTITPNHTVIKELKQTCDFEAEVEWFVGVSSPNRYRVLELKNPTRLVVDIKHNR